MLGDILLYGSAAFGCAVAVRRIQWKSLRNCLPSKTLKGSPEDLCPAEVAISVVLPKLTQYYEKCNVSSDRLVFNNHEFEITLVSTRYWSEPGSKVRCHLSVYKTDRHITHEVLSNSPLFKDIHKVALSIKKLKEAKEKQVAKERADAAALAILEDLLKIDTKADVAER